MDTYLFIPQGQIYYGIQKIIKEDSLQTLD
jgi:hypothetical protein